MADLHEILNISEVGFAIQAACSMEVNQQVELTLDLAEISGPIPATARVIWSDQSGRVGFSLPVLPDSSLRRLREWLFLNSMAGAANAARAADVDRVPTATKTLSNEKPIISVLESAKSKISDVEISHTDPAKSQKPGDSEIASEKLIGSHPGVASVLGQEPSINSNLDELLGLIAANSQVLLKASGAAIAMAGVGESHVKVMQCRASAGESAPPVGSLLQVGSGFSGECVRLATTLRCDDSETDARVDRESCRTLGIRSMLAVPIGSSAETVGLIEVFSAERAAFDESDELLLQEFSGTILAALNAAPPKAPAPGSSNAGDMEAVKSKTISPASPNSAKTSDPVNAPGTSEPARSSPTGVARSRSSNWSPISGVLFTALRKENVSEISKTDQAGFARYRLSRKYLYILIFVVAALALMLGFLLAPWLQAKLQAASASNNQRLSTAVAPPASRATLQNASLDPANFGQLRELALRGDAQAENALGLLYAQGDEKQGIEQDQSEAARWFTKAAEHGDVPAQYKLGLLYWGGHGVPKDPNKAYFWAVLARAGGQEGSQDLTNVLANGMTRAQAAAIERQANIWYEQHEARGKPQAGR